MNTFFTRRSDNTPTAQLADHLLTELDKFDWRMGHYLHRSPSWDEMLRMLESALARSNLRLTPINPHEE